MKTVSNEHIRPFQLRTYDCCSAFLRKSLLKANRFNIMLEYAQCIGTRTGVLSGSPDPRHISTSYVERYNLNLRMGRSALHATHKRLFKGIREPLPSRGDLPHLLQLLPRPPDFAGDARDGSRSNRSRVVNGGTDRAARSDESQRGLTL